MRAVFHAKHAVADITDYQFYVHAYYVSGTFEPGMIVRFRPQARLGRSYVLHSIELDELFSELEKRPVYDLLIQCGTLEETEFLYSLCIRDEDIELVSDPDRWLLCFHEQFPRIMAAATPPQSQPAAATLRSDCR